MENSDKNLAEGPQMPLGLGMALAQNVDAMNYFAALSEREKHRIIEHTHQIGSSKEMRAYVQQMAKGTHGTP